MKRHIDRIYTIKNTHNADNEYESIGEMNRIIHKKEPYIFTVTATNPIGDSTSEPTTTDVVPFTAPVISNITTGYEQYFGSTSVSFNVNNGGSRISNIKLSTSDNYFSAEAKINPTDNKFLSSSNTTTDTSGLATNYFSLTPIETDNENIRYTMNISKEKLKPLTDYIFVVKVTNSYGVTTSQTTSPFRTKSALEKPSIITAVVEKNGEITLTCKQPGTGSLSFNIEATAKEESSMEETKISSWYFPTSSNVILKIPGLKLGTKYSITIIGKIAAGNSEPSDPVTVTPTSVPKNPTGVSALVLSTEAGTVKVLFNELTNIIDKGGVDAIKSYKVVSNPKNISATGTNSPITITGLDPGTPYTFTVTAENVNGTSSPSDPSVSITTPTKPSKTSWDITTPTKPLSNSIEFKFKTPSDGGSNITSYKFNAYYTDDAGKIYYEIIEVPTSKVTNNNDGTSTVTLYTKQQKKYTKIPVATSDLYPSDATKNPVEITTNKTLSLTAPIESYANVPLLYSPIGSEREGYYYNDVKNNKTFQNYNKFIYILRIIFIIFVILVLLTNDKIKNKIKVFVKSILSF